MIGVQILDLPVRHGAAAGGSSASGAGFAQRLGFLVGDDVLRIHDTDAALLHDEAGEVQILDDAGSLPVLVLRMRCTSARHSLRRASLPSRLVRSVKPLPLKMFSRLLRITGMWVLHGIDVFFVAGHDFDGDLQEAHRALLLETDHERRIEGLVDGRRLGLSGSG